MNNIRMEEAPAEASANGSGDVVELFEFPATPQQQQLWFLDQLDPGNPVYDIPLAYELRGDLDADALDKSLCWLVNRHEAFRTVFANRGTGLSQIVRSKAESRFHRRDLRKIPVEERNRACRRAVDDAGAFRFDLAAGPLIRGELILLEPGHHVLTLNFHHISLDYLSVLLFAREFHLAYSSFRTGQAPTIDTPALQYPDFAVWQEEQLQGPRFQKELQEWVSGLKSAPASSIFPADRPRPRGQTFMGSEVEFSLPPDLSKAIREFAKTSKKSVYVTLLTLFKCLLARYSGQEDVVVGGSFSNRVAADLEEVMGCCMNTLPLRSQFGRRASFREAVEIVHQTILGTYNRQRVPLKLIIDTLNPARVAGMNPLFQTTFTFLDLPLRIDLEGLAITPLHVHNGGSKFDIAAWMWDSDGRLSGLWEYNTDLYGAETMQRMVRNFETLAAGAMAAPDSPWRRLSVVAPEELSLTRDAYDQSSRIWSNSFSLVELVEASAAERPEAVAVVFNGQELTYRELVQKADALSRELISAGVEKGSLVGIFVERSTDMIIAMLAILKSGGAYLPLDPSFPAERLSFMLVDAAVGIIVSNSGAVDQLPRHHAKTVLVDKIPASSSPMGASPSRLTPDSLAYVRYTSGSTGRPKGVAISHRALLNFLLSMRAEPGCTSQDVLLAVTTLSFDISELEIWLPLICGGRIVLAAQDQLVDGAELIRLMGQHAVTFMQATPATWRLLLESGWNGNARLRILCGGETLLPELAEILLPRCAELWNMYGPTETTVWSTCTRLVSSDEIHIGRPIANTEVYILDSELQPVPLGVTGELLIGGQGLAKGYLNRPELTAEKFISHPFKPGEKLYLTGDLAKYRSDGHIEWLGRSDFQVKIRAFRIELGEIEAALRERPDIAHAVVIARQEQLIAYYVSSSGQPIDASTCREALRSCLPEYMVPAMYVQIETIPLTVSGKVDRNALPDPDARASPVSGVCVAPRTDIERRLVTIWEETLNRGGIGVYDNFFDLGGHSLLAVSLFGRVEREFGHRLPLASLFQNPTIVQLSRLLEIDSTPSTAWDSLVCVRDGGKRPIVFLVHGAGGNILMYRDLARLLVPGLPIYGLQSVGLDGHKRPLTTIEEMAAAYVEEITRCQSTGPYVLAGYCMGGKVALEIARLLRERGESVGMLALLDSVNFNVANAATFQTSKLSHFRERATFHARNIIARRPWELLPYLSEKARLAREAVSGWLLSAFKTFRARNAKPVEGKVSVTDFIQAVNDRAGFAYIPRPYTGSATIFRPRRTYPALTHPQFGWGPVVKGPLEIVELDMNPHAMLIEPFVQELAAQINVRLQRLLPKLDI